MAHQLYDDEQSVSGGPRYVLRLRRYCEGALNISLLLIAAACRTLLHL